METNRKVGTWRTEVKDALIQRFMDGDNPNKYSGYVYDAVWLYAHSLDRLIKQNQSYIQDIHSRRSINKYVDIISSMDFDGVSGRINFPNNGHSRLSNIKVGNHTRFFSYIQDIHSRSTNRNIENLYELSCLLSYYKMRLSLFF